MTAAPSRRAALAVSLPLDGLSLAEHDGAVARLSASGYDEIWTGETDGYDALTPLVYLGARHPELRVAAGIANVFTRGPALIAMQAAALADALPGRATFGIGSSSNVIVERWNGLGFERPYTRVAETLHLLRAVLAGGRTDDSYETFESTGFRLSRVPEVPPRLLVAALGPRMLGLAAAEADRVLLNYLSAADTESVRQHLATAPRHRPGDLEVSVRVFVLPERSPGEADEGARRAIASYLNVPVYRNFQAWLGRGEALAEMWAAWELGDRKQAVRVIPQTVVDDLMIHGSPEACAVALARYEAAGADTITVNLLQLGPTRLDSDEQVEFLEQLAQQFRR